MCFNLLNIPKDLSNELNATIFPENWQPHSDNELVMVTEELPLSFSGLIILVAGRPSL